MDDGDGGGGGRWKVDGFIDKMKNHITGALWLMVDRELNRVVKYVEMISDNFIMFSDHAYHSLKYVP